MNTPKQPSMNPCDQLKECLLEQGETAIAEHPKLSAHLESCAACQRLLRAWSEVPGLLEQLPEHEPAPVLAERVTAAVAPGVTNGKRSLRRFLAPSLASAAVLLAAVGLSRELLLLESPRAPVSWSQLEALEEAQRGAANRSDDSSKTTQAKEKNEVGGYRREPEFDAPAPALQQLPFKPPPPSQPPKQDVWDNDGDRIVFSDELAASTEKTALEQDVSKDLLIERFEPPEGALEMAVTGKAISLPESPVIEGATNPGRKKTADRNNVLSESREREELLLVDKRQVVEELAGLELENVVVSAAAVGEIDLNSDVQPMPIAGQVFDFLSYYEDTHAITTQAAIGYWANTHVPGDPQIRLLQARLAQWDRSWLKNDAGLEQSVRPVHQPFDAPADNALALSLMSDVSAIGIKGARSEPTRLRLQVGIQGIEHRRGQRPAMNLGVVLDLPVDASDELRIAARALLDGLLQAKQAGDRFSLVITGRPGHSLVVESDDFRFGSLQMVKQLIAGESTDAALEAGIQAAPSGIDIYLAMHRAGELVRQSDDPGQPLGSSSVWLVGGNTLDQSELKNLSSLAHQQAQEGITTSVFPLGDQLSRGQVETLVLAGLGSRRYLVEPAQARSLVEEELHSASRAVARAVRLSVRLAPGVKLIEVVGSERLDTTQAQRVRDIETSMDRRLSANLGIHADRGEDEDGVQVVIPGIYSGDSVTVLLDLITDRPGAIADVSLRYKDLVYLRNGSLSAQLDLPATHQSDDLDSRSPAELSVLKNLLTWHFSQAVEQAADALGQQRPGEAIAILRAMHATIEQARADMPAWNNDPDLMRDQQVLERYIAALESPGATSQESFLADSLRLAAWAKTHPMPLEWK